MVNHTEDHTEDHTVGSVINDKPGGSMWLTIDANDGNR